MDVTVEVAAMEAEAHVVEVSVVAETVVTLFVANSIIESVASPSCPSVNGHSLSAVTPDNNYFERTAYAA